MVYKINIRELKDNVNLFFYEKLNCGLDELKVISKLCEKLAALANEQLEIYYCYQTY
jgi:hypothetical protein